MAKFTRRRGGPVHRMVGGWIWTCKTPGVWWSVSTGQYLFNTDGGWWLMGNLRETQMSSRLLHDAMLEAIPLLQFAEEG